MKFIKCQSNVMNIKELRRLHFERVEDEKRVPKESYDAILQFESQSFRYPFYFYNDKTRPHLKAETFLDSFTRFIESERRIFDADKVYNCVDS